MSIFLVLAFLFFVGALLFLFNATLRFVGKNYTHRHHS